MLFVQEHSVPAERGQHTCDDVQGLEVSLGRFFQDQLVQCEIGYSSFESCVLQFQFLQFPGLVDGETTVFVSPPVISLLGYRYLFYCASNRFALGKGNFYFTKLAQDLLRTVFPSWHLYPLQKPEFLTFTLDYLLGGSNCLGCQALINTPRPAVLEAFHFSLFLTMLLRIRSNFRIHAVRATFFGLPAAHSRR